MNVRHAFFTVLLWSAAALPAALAADPDPSTVYVEVNAGRIREKPQHWGRSVAEVRYGDPLTVLSRDNGWARVRSGSGGEGYIHETAVTLRRVVLSEGAAAPQMNATDSDIVLAGKGFNREVEELYASKASGVDYAAVDLMERRTASDSDLARFIAEGSLAQQGGGQP